LLSLSLSLHDTSVNVYISPHLSIFLSVCI
jgi:hypothetical protein